MPKCAIAGFSGSCVETVFLHTCPIFHSHQQSMVQFQHIFCSIWCRHYFYASHSERCILISHCGFFLIKVELIYNVVPISVLQQSDPVIHTHTHTHTHSFSRIIFYHDLSQERGYSSLFCIVEPYCASILNVIVCLYRPQIPSLFHSLSPPLNNHKSVLYVCGSVSVL